MKILVFGAKGFIGRFVSWKLMEVAEVYRADRTGDKEVLGVDLLNKSEIAQILKEIRPDVVINCAGTVENSETAFTVNPVITFNILSAAKECNINVHYFLCGSAGEYGLVEKLPVSEETPLRGEINYAKSKIIEESVARFFKEEGTKVTILRIFNPIGPGMHPRFLIPSLIKQLGEIKSGNKQAIELSRLDAKRDYIDVRDIADAIAYLISRGKEGIYNIGSGSSTSNDELLSMILKSLDVERPKITETSNTPEAQFAIQADISKLKKDTDWTPKIEIEDTIADIVKVIKESK